MPLIQYDYSGIDGMISRMTELLAMPKFELGITLWPDIQTYQEIIVKQQDGDEIIDIDFPALKTDESYLINYQNELYAIKKISRHKFAFYDVI